MSNNTTLRNTNTWGIYGSQYTSPYELLIRQSRKLGRAATHTLQFLQKDVTVLAPSRVISGGKREKNRGKLNEIIDQGREKLAEARTVMLPNNLFTDTVTVDRHKVTIHQRTFFWSSDIISIRIEDILNVRTSIGPFFGSLTVSSRVMNSTDHFEINYFWRKDAIELKHIIQGYVIALHNGVDVSEMTTDKLRQKLSELGHDPNA